MALYPPDDEMVRVETPDGRVLHLPASLASQLQLPDQQSSSDNGEGDLVGVAPPIGIIRDLGNAQGPGTTLPKPPYKGRSSKAGPASSSPVPVMPGTTAAPPPPPGPAKIGNSGPPVEETAGPTPAARTDNRTVADVLGGEPTTNMVGSSVTEGALNYQPPPPVAKEAKGGKATPGAVAPQQSQDRYQQAADKVEGGYNKQAEAERAVANAQALQEMALGNAYGDQVTRLDQIFAEQKQRSDEMLARINQKTAQFDQGVQSYANAKVDRNVDHPFIAMLGVILGGIGASLPARMGGNGGQNPAIDALYKAIDRKAAAQEADIDRQDKALGFQKDSINNLRQMATDANARADAFRAAETTRAAVLVKQIAAQSNSDIVKAKGDQLASELYTRAQQFRADAVDKQIHHEDTVAKIKQEDMASQRSAAVGYAGIAQRREEAANELKFKREQLDATLAEAAMRANAEGNKAKAAQLASAQKENEERAVGNAATGELLAQPEGKLKMQEAAKLEDQAKQVEQQMASLKPEMQNAAKVRADALRQKAADIRTDVAQNGIWRVNKEERQKVSDQYAAAQHINDLRYEIKDMYDDAGKRWTSTDAKQAAIQAKTTELMMAMKQAWQLGVLSKRDMDVVNSATGGDPTKAWDEHTVGTLAHDLGLDIGLDPEAFKGRLDTLADDTKKQTVGTFRTKGYRGDQKDLFYEEKRADMNSPVRQAVKNIAADKTVEENAAALAPNAVTSSKIGEHAQRAFYGTTSAEVSEEARNSGGRWGFSKDQDKNVQTLIDTYKKGGDAGKEAAQLLVEQAQQNAIDRPHLTTATLNALRDEAPELYKAARSQILTGPAAEQAAYVENPNTWKEGQQVYPYHGGLSAERASYQKRFAPQANDAQQSIINLANAAAQGNDDMALAGLKRLADNGDAMGKAYYDAAIQWRQTHAPRLQGAR